MNTGRRVVKTAGKVMLCLVAVSLGLCGLNSLSFGRAADTQSHPHKKKKTPELPPPLPSGPTGRPVPQVPLDSMRPIAPQVSYQNGLLTIVSPNSTLGDILKAVKKLTQAEIDIPDAPERVVMRLGPGTPREVVAELLNGSRFNYVLLGSPEDANLLTRVVLVAKSGPETPPGAKPGQPAPAAEAANGHAPAAAPAQEMAQEANDADTVEENAEENAEPTPPAAEATEPRASDSNQPKTPQQLLQEMQQRQLLMQQQQQQQPGQPPVPGPGVQPPQPPQPQQQQEPQS